MTPNYEKAATQALEILRDSGITETPVFPLPILKNLPGVRVMSFSEMADENGIERKNLIPLFGRNQDAATFVFNIPGFEEIKYVVIYNMQLTFERIRKAAARELGHIILGHDGVTRTTEVRLAEAMAFAFNLLCPRPILNMLIEGGVPLTMNVLKDTIGCSEECVEGMRKIPGVHVPAELNRQVRALFEPHIAEYIRFHNTWPVKDTSPVADLGNYMDNYEE